MLWRSGIKRLAGSGSKKCQTWMQSLIAVRCRNIALALGIALQVPSPSVAANHREIPFENSRIFGLLLVRVEANGRPAVLIVDTGSNVTMINSDLADVAPGTQDISASHAEGSFFVGRGVLRHATLRIGPIVWRNHVVIVSETQALSKSLGQKIDGILGIDFFGQFSVLVLDLKNHKLILDP